MVETEEGNGKMQFRKRPVIIEAFQMTLKQRDTNIDWPEWLHRAWNKDRNDVGSLHPSIEGDGGGPLAIHTLEGDLIISWNDWIIQGIEGELYPCKPSIFRATYEPI